MAFMQMGNRMALIMALCLLILSLLSLPLQAEEKPPQKSPEETAPDDQAAAGKEGMASYYAKRYNGRRTLSGARYRPEKLTAASHRRARVAGERCGTLAGRLIRRGSLILIRAGQV